MKKVEINTKQAMRYSRHIMLADFDLEKQETLLNSRVLIIGIGGLGCAAAQYLTASGVGALTLIDDDHVEETNLQRQVLHFEANLNQKKVDSAISTLQQINTGVTFSAIVTRQTLPQLTELMQSHDIVLDCTDNLDSRNDINAACYATKTPLVSAAAIRMEGQLFCVIPALHTACYACISRLFNEHTLSCSEAGVMSPLVGIMGATQALEAIKILTHYGEISTNTLHMYDAMQSQWTQLTVKAFSNCKVCGD